MEGYIRRRGRWWRMRDHFRHTLVTRGRKMQLVDGHKREPSLSTSFVFFSFLFFIWYTFTYHSHLFLLYISTTIMAPITPEITSSMHWLSQMDVNVEPTITRKSTIIGTIGKTYQSKQGWKQNRGCRVLFSCLVSLALTYNSSNLSLIGPKTNSVEMITQLRNAGLNVVRMNFSHGSYEVRLVWFW